MKLALFNDFQLGVIVDDIIYEIGSHLFSRFHQGIGFCPMVQLIAEFDTYRSKIEKKLHEYPAYALTDVRLRQPVKKPGKIVAAPVNYVSHQKEMKVEHTARGLGFFLKAPSSIIGPNDTIVLPDPNRRFDHELELAFVIGKTAKNVKAENAYDYIFGYTGLMDVTLRPDEMHHEERCLRKSFDTFTPMGPWIVTKEEVADPNNINMVLTVNGEVRQRVNTKEMICSVAELLEIYSHIMTLEPGDVITTGTPDGVGPIHDGDVVSMEIEGIGSYSVRVSLAPNAAVLR
ncbi:MULTISPECIES: fumarylacetoacetate hydrolase family protein [unclassified Geobacillus]|uniref:fumarylacetoacetate hydrolase family protein n=1 Tax=unclassified Geobacillus TaxID=2642459 RepID=UPI000D34FF6F|nr:MULTISPECIES: fumarylacetoacetate hydrolase family protein [unclassified Geobacillus]PUF86867.1 FAA hydrolase family protein [Geobacillus sp. LYN3]RDV21222.1 FAA hydrolase family protein [Parageobacillus toebii]TXK87707.1 fumarylacetoacetate hydrolase family protein [Geobacillus sp. AYS3]